ncbi:myb/SANT-like DNA-binding domain-containing protein 3 [Neodiprion pinetum]|uniref:myb/SANT-like DNA-binding domain-containing protein 3 n=1 Tax=Neodiprion pinetum TaxID=441929 RepID=UPI001EDC9D0D|nr:myb/SANT-like DNA-binding domain-containing protein 3 [Neodiprion pinetum]
MSGKKHYTETEKRLFLNILKKFSHIIENRKSDTSTLKDKEEAWRQIAEEYNSSLIISAKRNVQQLKKMWSHMKTTQRNALTKEKQSHLTTGGGPKEPSADVEPDIASIVPHIMTTAPIVFSSNIPVEILQEHREAVFNDELNVLVSEMQKDNEGDENTIVVELPSPPPETSNSCPNPSISSYGDMEVETSKFCPAMIFNQRSRSSVLDTPIPGKKMKKMDSCGKENIEENMLRSKHAKHLVELAQLKIKHEEEKFKEDMAFLQQKHHLELRAAKAAAKLAESRLN